MAVSPYQQTPVLNIPVKQLLAGEPAPDWGELPKQEQGSADGRPHTASTEDTRAKGGNGHKPKPGIGELPEDKPEKPKVTQGTSPKIKQGFVEETSKRLPAKSTETSDVFQNADGTVTRQLHQGPVNYQDSDGTWKPIDTDLQPAMDGRLQQKANTFDTDFAPSAADPKLARMTLGNGLEFAYGLQGAAQVAPVINESTATYPGVLPDTDLQLEATVQGMKESLILHTANASHFWAFPLQLQGLTAKLDADGAVLLLDAEGKQVSRIPKAFAFDSNIDKVSAEPATTYKVTYQLQDTTDGGQALVMILDEAWLKDPARVFPVTVDPTAGLSTTTTYAKSGIDPADHSGERYLKVGSYDNGTHSANSFLQFPGNGLDYSGANITHASLRIFVNHTTTCTPKPFYVSGINESWSPEKVTTYPGPAFGNPIGSATPHVPNACTNPGPNHDPRKGDWIDVGLDPALLNDWAFGDKENYGLALHAPTQGSEHWKQFLSANNISYEPILNITYDGAMLPWIEVQSPSSGFAAKTLTPQFTAVGKVDPSHHGQLKYKFTIYNSDENEIVTSGNITASHWKVPEGKLQWNTDYYWTVQAADNERAGRATWNSFTTQIPQPEVTSSLSQNENGFDPATGNYTNQETDADVDGVGPALEVVRSYNSRDSRTQGAFGTGWSSVFDAQAVEQKDPATGAVNSVMITYPDGSTVGYGRNHDGSFTPPKGRFASLYKTSDGYRLVDKLATNHRFAHNLATGVYGLSSITDSNDRALTFTWTSGRITKATAASGRNLFLTWATPQGATAAHVETISTDPATPNDPDSAQVWQYGYEGDKLVSACADGCTRYTYTPGNPLHSQTLDAGAKSYWPLAETSGTVATSAVLDNGGSDNGTYTDVTLGQPGHLTGTSTPAASFNGTTSMVALPKTVQAGILPAQTISMWFKTAHAGGVLYSYQHDPVTAGGITHGDYTPALYIGTNGKLHGMLWFGSIDAMQSPNQVNDGQWHHVALSATGNTQTLYLDGQQIGTREGQLKASGQLNGVIGAGYLGGGWPNQPHYNHADVTGHASFFNGSIADVAFFDRGLAAQEVTDLRAAASRQTGLLASITSPADRTAANVTYDPVTSAVTEVIDNNGGTWEISPPTVSGSSKVYRAAVLGSAPATYLRLADPGGTPQAFNEVNTGQATYSSVTTGVEGPFKDSSAASFNGTSSYLELPLHNQVQTQPGSMELWFKMPAGNTNGGVLFAQQEHSLASGTSTRWVPALYVGSDGKLHGKFWDTNGVNQGLTSQKPVNDGKWHHAVLATSANSQQLYLDGTQQGTINAALVASPSNYIYVGAGKTDGEWPNQPTDARGYFPGSIAEVAFYRNQLSKDNVAAHYGASKSAQGLALLKTVQVKEPGGHTTISQFDVANDNRKVSSTDALGHRTTYGYDTSGFMRTQTDPNGNVVTFGYDVRGNKVSETTCQNQTANTCATKYYSYWPDATTKHLAPNPKNDLLLTSRDGRSTGPNDDRYLTVYHYDDKGNRTTEVTPPVPGFPGGRFTKTSYTDDTTIAAADGGYALPGLPYKQVAPNGATTTTSYFKNGDIASVTNPLGLVTRYTYDSLGRKLTQTNISDTYPAGLVTSYEYDVLGRVISEIEPAVTNRVTGAIHTSRTTWVYDTDGNELSKTITDLTGGDAPRTTSVTFDSHGRKATETDARGNVTSYTYDVRGNENLKKHPSGNEVVSTYDANDNLLTTILKNYTGNPNSPSPARDLVLESRSYDPAERLASVTDVSGITTAYTYTDNGFTATETKIDVLGQQRYIVKETSYDAAGNPIKEVTNNGATVKTFTVDAANRVTRTVEDPDGVHRVTTVSYTADDQIATTTQTDQGGWSTTVSATYGPVGNKLSESINGDDVGHPVAWWKLKQTGGNTVTDASGTGHIASVSDHVTWDGDAAVFPGQDGQQIATNGPVIDTSQSFSVSAWVKLPTVPTRNATAVAQEGNRQPGFALMYSDYHKKWAFVRHKSDTDNAWGDDAVGTAIPAAGAWTHLIGTFDAATGQTRLYVNGNPQGTATATSPWNATGPLTIGRSKWNGNPADPFPGSIANVQVYNRLLSDSEATSLFDKGRTGGTTASHTKATTTWTYDQRGLGTSMTDPNGNVTHYEYNEVDKATAQIRPTVNTEIGGGQQLPQRPMTLTGYNTFDEVTEQQDANGNTTTIGYDAVGNKVSETRPPYTAPGTSTTTTVVSSWTYDSSNRPLTVTDVLGNVTRTEYDQLGNTSKTIDADGGETTAVYDLQGKPLATTSVTGAQTQYTYDYLGRELTTTLMDRYPTPTVATTTLSYAASSDNPGGAFLASVTSPSGKITKYEYNKLGEQTSIINPAGQATRTEYDSKGRTSKVVAADGTATLTFYDLLDKPTSVKQVDGDGTVLAETSKTYDANGQVLSTTDARGFTTTFTRDANGLVTSQTEPVDATKSITIGLGYDAAGNRTRYTDGRGNTYVYGYNTRNLQEYILQPATSAHTSDAERRTTIVYDAAGNTIKTILPGGVITTAQYDNLNRVTQQTGTDADAQTASRSFTYDSDGRMLTASTGNIGTQVEATELAFTYNDRGSLLTTQGSAGSSSFTYNNEGQETSRTTAAGTSTFTHDSAGRLSALTDAATGSTLTYGYDQLSQIKAIDYGTSKTRSFAYDKLHRLTGDSLKTNTGTVLASLDYGYDKNNNLVSKTTTGVTSAGVNTYTYDRNNRLISWNNGTATTSYEYDENGNRTKVGDAVYTYDARNQLTSDGQTTYTYSPYGTLRTQISGGTAVTSSSDAFGQQITDIRPGGATRTYLNDALGRNLKASGPSGTHIFAYSGANNTLVSDGTHTYSRGPGDSLIAIAGAAGSEVLAFTDQHNDVIANFTETSTTLTGSTTFDPLGTPTSTGMLGMLGYQSGWTDPTTNKVNMWSRWYNPATGQFQNKDTQDLSPIPRSGMANSFSYVAGNPVSDTDPDGHAPCFYVRCIVNPGIKNIANAEPQIYSRPKPAPIWNWQKAIQNINVQNQAAGANKTPDSLVAYFRSYRTPGRILDVARKAPDGYDFKTINRLKSYGIRVVNNAWLDLSKYRESMGWGKNTFEDRNRWANREFAKALQVIYSEMAKWSGDDSISPKEILDYKVTWVVSTIWVASPGGGGLTPRTVVFTQESVWRRQNQYRTREILRRLGQLGIPVLTATERGAHAEQGMENFHLASRDCPRSCGKVGEYNPVLRMIGADPKAVDYVRTTNVYSTRAFCSDTCANQARKFARLRDPRVFDYSDKLRAQDRAVRRAFVKGGHGFLGGMRPMTKAMIKRLEDVYGNDYGDRDGAWYGTFYSFYPDRVPSSEYTNGSYEKFCAFDPNRLTFRDSCEWYKDHAHDEASAW